MRVERERRYDPQQESRDLGFGAVVSQQRRLRLLNQDGSFNVRRVEPGLWQRLASYHGLLTMPWPRFFAVIFAGYLAINSVFAGAYLLCGPGALTGDDRTVPFLRAFFFSVHTFATIGYGNVAPMGLAANLVVTVEAMVGLLSLALATGLVFARFSRPHARLLYSRCAVLAPYRGITAFEFRVVNASNSELIELTARVVLSRFEEEEGGGRQRRYYPLPLERESVAFFPLSWTVVHPIDETSPLYGWDREQLVAAEAEFLVLITGVDESFAQVVHSRTSYTAEEVVGNARFRSMFRSGDGALGVDIEKLHEIEPVEPAPARSLQP